MKPGYRFLRVVASEARGNILKVLHDNGPLTYSELKFKSGFVSKKESGKFAYHLRKLRKYDLLKLDRPSRDYSLTDFGSLIRMLLAPLEDDDFTKTLYQKLYYVLVPEKVNELQKMAPVIKDIHEKLSALVEIGISGFPKELPTSEIGQNDPEIYRPDTPQAVTTLPETTLPVKETEKAEDETTKPIYTERIDRSQTQTSTVIAAEVKKPKLSITREDIGNFAKYNILVDEELVLRTFAENPLVVLEFIKSSPKHQYHLSEKGISIEDLEKELVKN